MTSRIPPSRRDGEHAPQRVAKAVAARTPGTGRVSQAAPVLPSAVAARLRGKASGSGSAGAVLHVSASALDAPVNGEPFWYRTDLSC